MKADDPPSQSAPSPWLDRVLIPVAIAAASGAFALISGLFQLRISRAETAAEQELASRQNYLGMAVGILSSRDNKDDALRAWGTEILSRYTPVPISEELRAKLRSGEVTVPYSASYKGYTIPGTVDSTYSGYSSPTFTPSYSPYSSPTFAPSYPPGGAQTPSEAKPKREIQVEEKK